MALTCSRRGCGGQNQEHACGSKGRPLVGADPEVTCLVLIRGGPVPSRCDPYSEQTEQGHSSGSRRTRGALIHKQSICQGVPGGVVVKNSPAGAGVVKRPGFHPWVGKIPWSGAWQPAPVFWPGESHGQRSLVGCSTRGHTKSDTTEMA